MRDTSARVAIVTDSTSDIPLDLAKSLDIVVVPALLMIEDSTFRDGIDLSREEFYRRLPNISKPPSTAVPSPLAFEQVYRERLDSGYEHLLSIHLSPKLSGMINVVNQAAEAFGDQVYIYDSQQVSLGLGFQAIEAAHAAMEGLPLEPILERLRKIRENVRLIAMIDTQEYLWRSGRVSWLSASLGKMLRMRLLVEVKRGVIERRGFVRTRGKAVQDLISLARSWGSLKRLAVLHTAVAEEARSLADQLRSQVTTPPLVVDATTLLGAYVGPAALGFAGLLQ
ncbi:MAG: DegV family EDD domain-containing protein [Anaerolineales bacterium]|nr:DegV family EDD domain-containing protein [Anaerolineales bacterium]